MNQTTELTEEEDQGEKKKGKVGEDAKVAATVANEVDKEEKTGKRWETT
jgi:hypothetical protein